MRNFKAEDYIILILSGILFFFFLSLAIRGLLTGLEMSVDRAKLVANLLSSITTIISLYIGSKLKNRNE